MAKQPVAQQRQVVAASQTVVHQSGPLPAPEILAGYDQLVQGSAERIIAMAESDQRHRISMDREAQQADIEHRSEVAAHQAANARAVFRSDMVGQVLAGMIALSSVGGAIYSIYAGAHWAATVAMVSLPIAAIIKAVREGVQSKPDKK